MSFPHCPQCNKHLVLRVHREGVVERLLSLCYLYPFRCQLCSHRFLALQWGRRFVKEYVGGREFERIPVRFPATFSNEHGQGAGTVVDLSVQGCLLETDASLPPDAVLALRIQGDDDHSRLEVEVAGVRWISRRQVGLEFLSLHAGESARLRRLIERLPPNG